MTGWHMPCASGDPGHEPGGNNTAAPTHKCVKCEKNVHTICAISWEDPNASFGEGHKCILCVGEDGGASTLQEPQALTEEKHDHDQEEGKSNSLPSLPSALPEYRPDYGRFAGPDDELFWEMPTQPIRLGFVVV